MPQTLYLISNDLIFTTKIVGTARELGVPIATRPTVQAALDALETEALGAQVAGVIVDLSGLRDADREALVRLRQRVAPGRPILAFGSHVAVETLAAARQAGCDPVLARSEFTRQLVPWLKQLGVSISAGHAARAGSDP